MQLFFCLDFTAANLWQIGVRSVQFLFRYLAPNYEKNDLLVVDRHLCVMAEQLIKIQLDSSGRASGVDSTQDQLLREASWKYNTIVVDLRSEGREVNVKFLGGNWLEC
jgi:hypothetical protein